ncbi:MAG: FkbM family methyltransferase [Bacteroidetes bacterium]|nr:FkbM family methyltransferase [Bacteroidota bacterium]
MSIKNLLSLDKRRKLVDIYNGLVKGYAMKYYSQEGEDIILKRIFDKKKTGFYVDIGAYHPKKYSNTYYFYKLGWKGINIDAMPGSMKAFNKSRPRDINLETPIASVKAKLEYFAFNEPALNSFNKELSESRDGKDGYKIIFRKEIETYTLSEMLSKHVPAEVKQIDFMSIDVETLDLDVLKSNDWNKYKPGLILIEDLLFDINNPAKSEIGSFLGQYGYTFYAKTVNTYFFKHKDYPIEL